MAIRVLLDHGVPQTNIIFLTFLISRRGLYAVHHAFPSVRIVTAAIDDGLIEMHLPITSVVMGEAAGDADFAVKVVNDFQDVGDQGDENEGSEEGTRVDQEDWRAGVDGLKTDGKADVEGFKMPEKRTEELKFSRKKKGDEGQEKRAWVISPGIGHVG